MRKTVLHLIILAAIIALSSCSGGEKGYKIGVSQCSGGRWREKVNSEMLAAQHLYDHPVSISIASSGDDTQLQIRQIDSLASSGIDLLVVAPNDGRAVSAAIDRVMARGIPVICFDRKAASGNYTAFIGGNNFEAGNTVGYHVVDVMRREATGRKFFVLEVTGSKSSSPAIERHKGFAEAMSGHTDIEYVWRDGKWSSDEAFKIVSDQIRSGKVPDIVFCHNDGMATGAYKAVVETKTEGKVKILGIDGMPGEGLEVESISATADELMEQTQNLVTVQDKLEEYFGLYNLQSKIIIAAGCAILLLAVGMLMIWRAVKQTRKANRRIRAMHDEQTAFYTNARHMLRTPLTLIAGPVKKIQDANVLKGEWSEMMDIVGRNVAQLETVVSSVLEFKSGMAQPSVDDHTAEAALGQKSLKESVQEGRLVQMKQDDSEELSDVLIVDDNDDMRCYLRTLLADKFYVLEAADGQSGLKLAHECVPDIIVSDVMMPVMDGLQFCQQLKEDSITSHIPVILLTARSTESQQVEGYEHGADAYITKPFNAQLLIARIYNLLKSRQQLRHLADGKKEETPMQLSTQDKLFADTLKKVFQQHLSNPNLKMDELGDELGMSRVQLYRKVKALTGTSPVELLREMRLQRGRTLINTTTKSIAEIAYEVGFHTPSYFSNCFKKQYGIYPTELRSE